VRWRARSRDLRAGLSTHRAYAAERGALVSHPLATPSFAAALARAGGGLGFGDRTAAMRELFGGLLPDALLARSSKATFGEVFWGDEARRFAERWDGRGVEADVVDAGALRRAWLAPTPDARGAMLLQAAWLEDDRRRGQGSAEDS
jgi:asparagine synthase (glutamine-hydrolysing)